MANVNTITYTCRNKILWITIARIEKHNAFDKQLLLTLCEAIQAGINNHNVIAICLQAAGHYFSTGADLNSLRNITNSDWEQTLAQVLLTWYQCPKPTLCIVQGDAYGGALGLIAASDYVIANEQAQFCFSELKLGLIPAVISPYILETMGYKQTKSLFLNAQKFSAQTALLKQLIDEALPQYELESRAQAILQNWLELPPEALHSIKPWLYTLKNVPIDAQLSTKTAAKLSEVRKTVSAQKLLNAFLQARKKG